ncbi:glycine/D-amino acid oxidase-like deaminating enzyme [Kushneria sinocarnis]|uniref:Glycine/D-amino acid oxidase-like deaminating enzyme n=1 Tax=Kushneria sinocarnis TaxID=595502 RepID=A0A420X1C2_9GAMM|nr:FAD-binding oxidoreductase [Kushneria sinocarnis]RKR07641.1 glycine/D-amino acid oxidase-like deaminating enzyme [Kushneria sinocarnis]
MYPHIQTVESSPALPDETDVAVIGGGIIGVATAWALARTGVRVTLLEKGVIAGEQSSRNWGWCRTMGRDEREIPLAMASLARWPELAAALSEDIGFKRTGILYACRNEAELTQQREWLARARHYGVSSRLLDSAELARYMPGVDPGAFVGALYTPDDGRAEPDVVAPAMARSAMRLGATLLQQCAVRGLETRAGRVHAVVTERGRVRTQAVVLAGGAWSSLFCRHLGIRLPQLKVLGSVMRTAPMPGGPDAALGTSGFSFRKRADGGYTISHRGGSLAPIVPDSFRYLRDFLPMMRTSREEFRLRLDARLWQEAWHHRRWSDDGVSPFERERVLDPVPSARVLKEATRQIGEAVPFFRDLEITQRWGGLIDVTPDAVPVIDAIDTLPGFHLATGFSGHGFGTAPGAGQLMADLVTGNTPLVDPTPYRFSRFAEADPTP